LTRSKVSRRFLAGFLADRRGAVAIEFAAIALPFILLLAGTMEISRYTWTRVALQDAASAGARCLGWVRDQTPIALSATAWMRRKRGAMCASRLWRGA
jgi:Flp pilus assembly protein TadG